MNPVFRIDNKTKQTITMSSSDLSWLGTAAGPSRRSTNVPVRPGNSYSSSSSSSFSPSFKLITTTVTSVDDDPDIRLIERQAQDKVAKLQQGLPRTQAQNNVIEIRDDPVVNERKRKQPLTYHPPPSNSPIYWTDDAANASYAKVNAAKKAPPRPPLPSGPPPPQQQRPQVKSMSIDEISHRKAQDLGYLNLLQRKEEQEEEALFEEDAHRKKSARASLLDQFGSRESSTGYDGYGGGFGNDHDQFSHGHYQHSNSSSSSSSYHRGNHHHHHQQQQNHHKNNFDQRAQQHVTRQVEHDVIQAQKEKNRLMREARMAKEKGSEKDSGASSSSYPHHQNHSSHAPPHHHHQSYGTDGDEMRRRDAREPTASDWNRKTTAGGGGAGAGGGGRGRGGGWISSNNPSRTDQHQHQHHSQHHHPFTDDEWPTFEEETITLPLSYNRNQAAGLGEGASSIVDVKPIKALFDVDKVSES